MKNTDFDQKLRENGQISSKMGILAKFYPKFDQYSFIYLTRIHLHEHDVSSPLGRLYISTSFLLDSWGTSSLCILPVGILPSCALYFDLVASFVRSWIVASLIEIRLGTGDDMCYVRSLLQIGKFLDFPGFAQSKNMLVRHYVVPLIVFSSIASTYHFP